MNEAMKMLTYIDPTHICTVKCKRVMFLSVYRLTRYLSVLCFACTVEKVTSCTLTARLLAFCILGLFLNMNSKFGF